MSYERACYLVGLPVEGLGPGREQLVLEPWPSPLSLSHPTSGCLSSGSSESSHFSSPACHPSSRSQPPSLLPPVTRAAPPRASSVCPLSLPPVPGIVARGFSRLPHLITLQWLPAPSEESRVLTAAGCPCTVPFDLVSLDPPLCPRGSSCLTSLPSLSTLPVLPLQGFSLAGPWTCNVSPDNLHGFPPPSNITSPWGLPPPSSKL